MKPTENFKLFWGRKNLQGRAGGQCSGVAPTFTFSRRLNSIIKLISQLKQSSFDTFASDSAIKSFCQPERYFI